MSSGLSVQWPRAKFDHELHDVGLSAVLMLAQRHARITLSVRDLTDGSNVRGHSRTVAMVRIDGALSMASTPTST